jgi:hypothetical protein
LVIAPDPAPDAAAALRARTLEQDRGNQSTRRRPAPNEMLGLIRGRLSDALANVFPAREVHAFIAPISS